jgi:hypothetical protein
MADIELTYREVETLSKEESLTEKYADLCEEDRAFELSPEHLAHEAYNYNVGLDEYGRYALKFIESDEYLSMRLSEVNGDRWRYIYNEYGKRIMAQAKELRERIEAKLEEQAINDGKFADGDPLKLIAARQEIIDTAREIVLHDVVYNNDNAIALIDEMEREYETSDGTSN